MSLTKHTKPFEEFMLNESEWEDDDSYEYDPDAELRATVEDILDHMPHEEYVKAAIRIVPDEIYNAFLEKVIEAAERNRWTLRGDIIEMIRGTRRGLDPLPFL